MPGARVAWYGPRIEKELRGRLARDLERCGDEVRKRARGYAPVDSGRLRASIEVVAEPARMRVSIGSDVSYASYQEFGTSRVPAVHFLRRGLDEATATFRFSTG